MKTAILSTLAVAALAGVAQADIVYATDFNAPLYSNGGLIGQDSWVITGTSVVNPINVANTGTNGNVALTNNGQDVRRAFPYSLTSGSVYLTADITISAAGASGDYFLHLGDNSATIFNARIYARASGGGFQMAMGTSAGAVTYGTTVLNFGQTYTILARYDFVPGLLNDTGALFINPLDPMGAGDTPYVAATTIGTDAVTISSVSLRQGTTANAPTLVIDNISIVPTPGAAALLGVGILAAGRRRRA